MFAALLFTVGFLASVKRIQCTLVEPFLDEAILGVPWLLRRKGGGCFVEIEHCQLQYAVFIRKGQRHKLVY